MDGDVYKADPIFPSGQKSSDLLKWKKFANSLRLRLAVRICNADRSKATEVIDELMENEQNLMTSNEDNCLLQWGDNADTRNYFYDYLVINDQIENSVEQVHAIISCEHFKTARNEDTIDMIQKDLKKFEGR